MCKELGDSYYQPDAQLTLAQVAMAQGDRVQAEMLAGLVHDQYAVRDDATLFTSVLLFEAELALQRHAQAEARTHYEQARALRQRARRALSPREQAHFAVLASMLADQFAPELDCT